MMVARLLLCYLLLEDYGFKLSTAITSDIVRHDFAPPNPTPDNSKFVFLKKFRTYICMFQTILNYNFFYIDYTGNNETSFKQFRK